MMIKRNTLYIRFRGRGYISMKKLNKKLFVILAIVTTMVLGSLASVSAAADSAVMAGVTTAVTSASDNILGAIAVVAPIALGIVGIFLAWKYGMRFFKGLSK